MIKKFVKGEYYISASNNVIKCLETYIYNGYDVCDVFHGVIMKTDDNSGYKIGYESHTWKCLAFELYDKKNILQNKYA